MTREEYMAGEEKERKRIEPETGRVSLRQIAEEFEGKAQVVRKYDHMAEKLLPAVGYSGEDQKKARQQVAELTEAIEDWLLKVHPQAKREEKLKQSQVIEKLEERIKLLACWFLLRLLASKGTALLVRYVQVCVKAGQDPDLGKLSRDIDEEMMG